MKNLFKIMMCMGFFCGMPVLASEKSNAAGSVAAPAQTDADAKVASEVSATAGSSNVQQDSPKDWPEAFDAVYFGDAELLNALLQQPGAPIDALNEHGQTLLDHACVIAYQQSKRHDMNGHDGRPYDLRTFHVLLNNKIDVAKSKGFILRSQGIENTIKPLHCLYMMRAIFGSPRYGYDDQVQAEKLQLLINRMWKSVAANLDAYA